MLFSRVSRVPRYRFYRLFSALQDLTSVVNGLAACAAQPEQFLSKLLSVSKEDFNRALVLLIQQRQYSRVIDIINALPEQHSYRNESTKLSSLIATAHSNDAAKAVKIAKSCADGVLSAAVIINMHCETDKLHVAEAQFLPLLRSNPSTAQLCDELLDNRSLPSTSAPIASSAPLCMYLSMLRGYSNRGAWKQCRAIITALSDDALTGNSSDEEKQLISEFCTTSELITHSTPAPALSVLTHILSQASLSPRMLVHLVPLLKHLRLFTNTSTLASLAQAIAAKIIEIHTSPPPSANVNDVAESFNINMYTSHLLQPPSSVEITKRLICNLVEALSVGKGMNELSLDLVQQLKSKRVPIPDEAYGFIIQAYIEQFAPLPHDNSTQGFCNAYRLDDALKLYDHLLSYGATPLTLHLYHSLADCVIEKLSESDVEKFVVKYSAAHESIR